MLVLSLARIPSLYGTADRWRTSPPPLTGLPLRSPLRLPGRGMRLPGASTALATERR